MSQPNEDFCFWCGERFLSDLIFQTEYFENKIFCSNSCVEEAEEKAQNKELT